MSLPPFPRNRVPQHCAQCGSKVIDRARDRHPYKCERGHLVFVSPQLVSVAVVFYKRRVVMTKRGRNPMRDHWALPGGFTEWGENSSTTAWREFSEEPLRGQAHHEPPLPVSWAFVGERPGTDEMSHLMVWGAVWPDYLPLVYSTPDMDETLAVGDFPLTELPEPLAYQYQRDFIHRAAVMLLP